MRYDIYFHGGCFDGAASAAMLLYFLRLRGDSYGKFIPLTHPVNKKWWKALKMKRPSAVVDILYHPKAKTWFDHHPTTFIDAKWERKFKMSKLSNLQRLTSNIHVLDIKSPSCTGLIYRHLTKVLKTKPPKYIKELVRWTDITDRIQHKIIFVKDLLELKSPALQIGFYLDSEEKVSTARQKQLIEALSKTPLLSVARIPWIRRGFLKYKKKLDGSLPKIKNMLTLYGNVVFVENLSRKVIGTRFAPFYFYPKCNYAMRFVKHGEKFVLAVGVNPWNLPKNPAHIGKFLAKHYGKISAGGHSYAGSASFRTKEEALKAVSQITAHLNKHV